MIGRRCPDGCTPDGGQQAPHPLPQTRSEQIVGPALRVYAAQPAWGGVDEAAVTRVRNGTPIELAQPGPAEHRDVGRYDGLLQVKLRQCGDPLIREPEVVAGI